ncbi:MAG: helix-turn-helix domain-containing protein [Candidatus Bathyarchaeia archaeon]
MSQEQLLKTLATLGFDEIEAQIYLYLAKKGPQKACAINKALKLTKQQFYPSIKRLQSKGIVNSTMEHPARFSALPFEKVLDSFIIAKIEETRNLQQRKAEILANWQDLKLEDDTSAKFTVIEGRTFIYSKIHQMIQEATMQVLAITAVPTLAQADQRDVFEASYSKSKVQFRFLTELSEHTAQVMKSLLKETAKTRLKIEGRNPDLGLTLFPHMLVRDEKEALFFTKPRNETSIIEKDDVCLWTDCKPLVKAFTAMFEELWRNSTDIKEKIIEIETGKPTPKTFIIGDAEIARKKYLKTLKAAKEEILIMTSSKGLVELWEDMTKLSEWKERGVTVKVMAPIVSENLEVCKQLSEVCSVKHVPPNYQLTTIIDGKQLFQFKEFASRDPATRFTTCFDNTFYTNNYEYVKKTETMLNEIWRNSSVPSPDNLRTMFGEATYCAAFFPGAICSPGPHGAFYQFPLDPAKKSEYPTIVDDDHYGRMTEQDVLSEIVAAQKSPPNNGIWKFYSSQAVVIIHPPDFFNLPPMLFRAHHFERHSTFGEQDVIIVSLWLKTSSGYAYVPVAVLGNRSQAQFFWEKQFSATPAGRNFQLASKDELQIRVHGNTLFAGWTVPIPLYPSEYVLPPACILIEAYGDVKTDAYRIIQPTGEALKIRQNGFDAFVTFIHPSSKYSGPGTDGYLVRDFVLETTPHFFKGSIPWLDTVLFDERKPE